MAATKKNGKKRKSGGGTKAKGSSSSTTRKNKKRNPPSQTKTSTPKTNGKKKTARRPRKNNGITQHLSFKGASKAFKGTLIGTGGAFGSRVAADLGLGVAQNIMPRVGALQHPYARPVLTFLIGLFGIGHAANLLGMSQESQATARVGGMIAAGLDGLEVLVPDARASITGRFRSIAGRVRNAGGIDSSPVATNQLTSVANAAAAGAVQQALNAGMSPEAAQVVGTAAATGALQGLGTLQGGGGGGISSDDEEYGDEDYGDE